MVKRMLDHMEHVTFPSEEQEAGQSLRSCVSFLNSVPQGVCPPTRSLLVLSQNWKNCVCSAAQIREGESEMFFQVKTGCW